MLLNDNEKFALRVLAFVRSGIMQDLDCSRCPKVLQDDYNCDLSKPLDYEIFSPELNITLNTCPMNFLRHCKSVVEFIEDYDLYEKYPTAIKFDHNTVNARYWDAVKYYEGEMGDIRRRQHEQQMKK